MPEGYLYDQQTLALTVIAGVAAQVLDPIVAIPEDSTRGMSSQWFESTELQRCRVEDMHRIPILHPTKMSGFACGKCETDR